MSTIPQPYYEERGVVIYCGDAREIMASLSAVETVITDPVWPNSVFPDVLDPRQLLADVIARCPQTVNRVVIHLGCDSDPRFLAAVPSRWPFFRVCSLEYAQCAYKGRLLLTGDFAYVFGIPPKAKPGAMVLPGKVMASGRGRYVSRGSGRNKNKRLQGEIYDRIAHPCARDLDHVQWLAKWFGGSLVCDPFLGSGTTALACKNLGIPFVGIDIRREFCDLAVERLSQGRLPLESEPIIPTRDFGVSSNTEIRFQEQ